MSLVPATIVGGEKLLTHDPRLCADDDRCSVHKPSQHAMSAYPQHWREDRALMERTCPHGIGHPDPDHLHFIEKRFGVKRAITESVHGCDGCCAEKPKMQPLSTLWEKQSAHVVKDVVVLNLDGVPDSMGEVFDEKTTVTWTLGGQGVPSVLDFGKTPADNLGFAVLRQQGNKLLADVYIRRPFPGPVSLYPAVGGRVIQKKGPRFLDVTITEISLNTRPNADKRIEPIYLKPKDNLPTRLTEAQWSPITPENDPFPEKKE